MMKNLLYPLLALCLCVGLQSCDDDAERAAYLSGEWTGDMDMWFSDGYHDYSASYTDIRFIPYSDYATQGDGEQIDYFDYPCPIRYQSFYFHWYVNDGVISLEYPYDPNLNTKIYDYGMSDGRFYGYIGNSRFTLVKLTGYYNWNLYDDDYYGYGYYDDYYYGKTRSADQPADTLQPRPFRRHKNVH